MRSSGSRKVWGVCKLHEWERLTAANAHRATAEGSVGHKVVESLQAATLGCSQRWAHCLQPPQRWAWECSSDDVYQQLTV